MQLLHQIQHWKTQLVTFYVVLITNFGDTFLWILLKSTMNDWTDIMRYRNSQEVLLLLGKHTIFGGHRVWILLLIWRRYWQALTELTRFILNSNSKQCYKGDDDDFQLLGCAALVVKSTTLEEF